MLSAKNELNPVSSKTSLQVDTNYPIYISSLPMGETGCLISPSFFNPPTLTPEVFEPAGVVLEKPRETEQVLARRLTGDGFGHIPHENSQLLNWPEMVEDIVKDSFSERRTGMGMGRGFLIPLGAGTASAFTATAAEASQTYMQARESSKILGIISMLLARPGAALGTEKILGALAAAAPVFEAVPVPFVGAAGAAAGSWAAGEVRRHVLKMNAVGQFAQYSHVESTKGEKWMTRLNPVIGGLISGLFWGLRNAGHRLERAVMKGEVININKPVQKLINESITGKIYEDPEIFELVSQGLYFMIKAQLSDGLKVHLSKKEKKRLEANKELVAKTLDKVFAEPRLYDNEAIREVFKETILQLEKQHYRRDEIRLMLTSAAKAMFPAMFIKLALELPKIDLPAVFGFKGPDGAQLVPEGVYVPVTLRNQVPDSNNVPVLESGLIRDTAGQGVLSPSGSIARGVNGHYPVPVIKPYIIRKLYGDASYRVPEPVGHIENTSKLFNPNTCSVLPPGQVKDTGAEMVSEKILKKLGELEQIENTQTSAAKEALKQRKAAEAIAKRILNKMLKDEAAAEENYTLQETLRLAHEAQAAKEQAAAAGHAAQALVSGYDLNSSDLHTPLLEAGSTVLTGNEFKPEEVLIITQLQQATPEQISQTIAEVTREAVSEKVANPSLILSFGREAAGAWNSGGPQLIQYLQSTGPFAGYFFGKIIEAMACLGSIPTAGGAACPVLAGP